MITEEEVKQRFSKIAPTEDEAARHSVIRKKAGELALEMLDACKQGRNLSLALTHLEDAVMRANRAVLIEHD